jgi:hypothetical protein
MAEVTLKATGMLEPDPRGGLLRDLDARAADYTRDCAARAQAGSAVAELDLHILDQLASAIARDLRHWATLAYRLDLAATCPFDPRRAAALIAESVFEEILAPDAWAVLAASLDLAPCDA